MLLKRRPEMYAREIQATLGISHATVNHHMNSLNEAGFVTTQRRGKWMYYRLTPEGSRSIPQRG